MDIRTFIEMELDGDRAGNQIAFYKDAQRTVRYSDTLVSEADGKPIETLFLPTGKEIYAVVPVTHIEDQKLRAYLVVPPENQAYFDTVLGQKHDLSEPLLLPDTCWEKTQKGSNITVHFNLLATHDDATTAEGKTIDFTIKLYRITDADTELEFGNGKKLSLNCDSPPPALKDLKLVKDKTTGLATLLCNIDATEDELALRHRDLEHFVLYDVSLMVGPGTSDGGVSISYNDRDYINAQFDSASKAFIYTRASAGDNYELFEYGNAPENVVAGITLAYDFGTNIGAFNQALSLSDKAGLSTEKYPASGRLYKFESLEIFDANVVEGSNIYDDKYGSTAYRPYIGDTSGFAKISLSCAGIKYNLLSLPSPMEGIPIKYAYLSLDTEGNYTVKGTAQDYNAILEIEDGYYELMVWAEKSGYTSSEETRLKLWVQKNIYVAEGGDDTTGTGFNPLRPSAERLRRCRT